MRHFHFVSALGLSLFVLLSGCKTDDGRPKDLPKLYSCTITVIQDGQPLEGANVTFRAKDPTVKFATCSGTTDASGTAKIMTYGFPGVPTGSYKVIVKKIISEGGEPSTDASKISSGKKVSEYSLVASEFTKEDTTTLEMEITTQKSEQTFDVGKSVKDFIGFRP